MALGAYALPFGLRQVKLVPLKDDGTEDTTKAQFLPASRTFTFAEAEDFETLQGDDRTMASHGSGPTATWDLEGGGISLDVWKILSGGTIVESGGHSERGPYLHQEDQRLAPVLQRLRSSDQRQWRRLPHGRLPLQG